MQKNTITQKYQLIDDQSEFRIQELSGLAKQKIQTFGKDYQILSIIGSQSSGKSTLLNNIFHTEFQTLNRKMRVGQTTKGIWYSIDIPSKMIILDVEGSDSTQRQQQRTKIQRRNSLFALSVSHILLINLNISQFGLYKGSQLAILEVILELNLKLFGSEKPKEIIFVIRDFDANKQNQTTLRQTLFKKVDQAWHKIPKPPGKTLIKLDDLFNLQAFFLANPTYAQTKQKFVKDVSMLREHLVTNKQKHLTTQHNVLMKDFPIYMKNLWTTIQQDKDINLPQQKILLSNMRCHEIQKKVYEQFEQEFRDQLQKSQRKMNYDFAKNTNQIVQNIIKAYNQQTNTYSKEQADKILQEFLETIERKIKLSYSFQITMISDDCLKEFVQQVNRNFLKDKKIDTIIKTIKPQIIRKFQDLVSRVSYKPEWATSQKGKFIKLVEQSFQHQKQKIISDSLKDFDRTIKKQVEGLVSNAFYDKTIFCQKFWTHITLSFKQIQHKIKNSIIGLYSKLDIKQKEETSKLNRRTTQLIDRATNNAQEELKTIIEMKCNDLLYFIMKHFSVDFNMDDKQIPRQWVDLKPEQITALYQSCKSKYMKIVENFKSFNLKPEQVASTMQKTKLVNRNSLTMQGSSISLLKGGQLMNLIKKLQQQMKNLYEQALKKNKQVYAGSIPKWGWIIFLIVALDDIALWLHSPYLAIPLTLILIAVVAVFAFGGKSAANNIVNIAKGGAKNFIAGMTTRAASQMLKKD